MRRSSLAAAGFMVVSGAALAQVARTPDGKDVPYANQMPSNAATMNSPATAPRRDTTGNDTAPSASDQKTESAAPRR